MKLARNPRTAYRAMSGRMVVVSIDQNRIFILNSTGTRIWQALDEPREVDSLTRDILSAFQVEKDTASADCQRFCDDLRHRGLIIEVP